MAGKKQYMAPMMRNLMKNVDLDRTNFISWPRLFGMHSTCMQTERIHYWWIQKNVWITSFCWSNWKITTVGKSLRGRRLRGPTTWKDTLKNALKDIANRWTKRQHQNTSSHRNRKLFAKSRIQTQTEGELRCWSIVACGLRHHKRKFFSGRVSVVHLWR